MKLKEGQHKNLKLSHLSESFGRPFLMHTSSAGVWPGFLFKSGSCKMFPVWITSFWVIFSKFTSENGRMMSCQPLWIHVHHSFQTVQITYCYKTGFGCPIRASYISDNNNRAELVWAMTCRTKPDDCEFRACSSGSEIVS